MLRGHTRDAEEPAERCFACLIRQPRRRVARQSCRRRFPRTNATICPRDDRINVWDIIWRGQPTVMHRQSNQVGTYYSARGPARDHDALTARSAQPTEVAPLETRTVTRTSRKANTDPPLRRCHRAHQEKPSFSLRLESALRPFPARAPNSAVTTTA